jgi:hypothetical protein
MQCCTCNSQLSPEDRFCPNCGMATSYNSSQEALNDPTVATPRYQPLLISPYSASSPPPPPPPPFYSTSPSEAARHRKWHWGNTFVAVLITTILLIAASMVILVQGFHLFGFNQHPTSNPIRIPTTANSSLITNSPSISPTITITRNNAGNIFDAAGILDQNQVKIAGASLQYPVDIYTTRDFSGTSLQFEQRARSHVTNSNMIVMAINTNPGHVTVVAGSAVPLSNSGADSVISSFRNSYQSSGSNYTSATISALQQLQNLLA